VFSFSQFFITRGAQDVHTLSGSYDVGLVILSLLIAMGASYMALSLADIAQRGYTRFMQRLHLVTGSLALGTGVWAMHFIGMLAFRLGVPVHYHAGITLLSAVPSLLASWVTLTMLVRHAVTLPRLLAGGVAVGLGIGTMHYTGMAAMQLQPTLLYDPTLFIVSILVAVSLAALALWISFGLRLHLDIGDGTLRLVAAVVMGLAISGMHYTAMQAARFVGSPQPGYHAEHNSQFALAIGIAAVTVVLSLLVAAVNALARYQDLLRRSEQSASELKAMFDTAVDGIVKIAPNGTILAANRSAQNLLGYAEHEMLGNNVSLLMPEPHRSQHDGYLEQYLRTGQARIIGSGREVIARHKSGREIPVRLALGESRLGNQHIFVGFLSDVSEQKALERELQERERQYRTLISNIPGAAFRCLWDEHWTTLFISDYIHTLTGWPAGDFMQGTVTLASLLHPDDLARLDQEMEQARINQASYALKYRMRHRNGTWLWIEEIATPIFQAGSDQVRWIDGILMDITQRQHLETQLRESKYQAEQAALAKSAFLANMSHEIRTPMNAVIGFTELVLETPLNDQQVRNLTIVRTSARSLLSLLNDILDTAKLESGHTELESRNFSLRNVCEQILATQSLAAGRKKVQLCLRYHPQVPDFFMGDPLRVQQILLNLISNAVKFTDTGTVTVHVRPAAGGVAVTVRDTGIGIAPDRLQRIFEPFSQADSSMTRRFGGTGLGTTIARQLTQLMKGRISVVSVPGKGTAFRVHLPLQPGTPVEVRASHIAEIELPPLRLLVADDVEQNLELIVALLGARKHQITTATDGQQAVQLYRDGSFDAVLLDVQMPVMNGHDACREIRRIEREYRRKPVPIIALTASVTEQDRRQATEAGMDGFAVKPLDLHEITSELARLTRMPGIPIPRKPPAPAAVERVVDTEKIAGLWGSQSAHVRALARFLNATDTAPSHLENQLQAGDTDQALQLTHRIKGTAGNLCLTHIYSVLSDLENQLSGQHLNAARSTVSRYHAAFEAACNYLLALPVPDLPDDEAALCGEPLDIDLLRELIQKLERGETPTELLTSLRAALPRDIYEQALEAMDNFEPDLAATALKAICDNPPSQEPT
jgi:PAS domain S-box-containing protein